MVSTGKIRIFLVDEHPVMAHGVGLVFSREPDLQLCEHASSLRHLAERIELAAPQVVVLDIAIDGGAALELLPDLRSRLPHVKVLCFSIHEEEFFAERSLRAGASGYLMKAADGATLVQAIRCVARGGVYLSESMGRRILRRLTERTPADARMPISTLTNRELRIVQHIGQTRSNHEIAQLLCLSVKTVEAHRSRIKEKLALSSTSDLIRFATHWVECQAGFAGRAT